MGDSAEKVSARQAAHWAFQIDPYSLMRIIRGASRLAGLRSRREYTWAAVMEIFAVGRMSAHALCERAGIDPDAKFGRLSHV